MQLLTLLTSPLDSLYSSTSTHMVHNLEGRPGVELLGKLLPVSLLNNCRCIDGL
jgi:hypothetical protein